MADDLATAARDLSVLPRADRRAILAAMQPEERRQIEAAMRDGLRTTPVESALHSPWFDSLQASVEVTAAARAALAATSSPDPATEVPRPTGRSLMQAAGGLFAHAGLRR